MYPERVTEIVIRVPARRRCSSQRIRRALPLERVLDAVRFGQPLPMHFTFTMAPRGARTPSVRIRVLDRPRWAVTRTRASSCGSEVTGGTGRARTFIVTAFELAAPAESTTRSRTVCAPAVVKLFEVVLPVASSYWPSPSRSHASEVSGPSGSPETDTRLTGSPT